MRLEEGGIKVLVKKFWTHPLFGKTLLWKNRVKIFCDAGGPIFRWYPRFRRLHYHKFWGLKGFAAYLWGREINFCFGEDQKGLYNRK
jgi:hypothetical protein